MKKSRFLSIAIAALALASAAFASPPPTASPTSFDREQIAAGSMDVQKSEAIATTGTGTESAYKAFEQGRDAQPAPRTVGQWLRMYPGIGPNDKLTSVQREHLLQALHRSSGGGGSTCNEKDDESSLGIRRPLT